MELKGTISEKVTVINVNFNSTSTSIDYLAKRHTLLLID